MMSGSTSSRCPSVRLTLKLSSCSASDEMPAYSSSPSANLPSKIVADLLRTGMSSWPTVSLRTWYLKQASCTTSSGILLYILSKYSMCLWQQAMRLSLTAITERPSENTHCLDFRTSSRNCLFSEPSVHIYLGVSTESSLARAETSFNATHSNADPSLRSTTTTASIFLCFRFESYSSATRSRRLLQRSSRSTKPVMRQFFSRRFFISSCNSSMAISNFLFSPSASARRTLSPSASLLLSSSCVLKPSSTSFSVLFNFSLLSFRMRFSSTSVLVLSLNLRSQLRITYSCCSSLSWANCALTLMWSMFFCSPRNASTTCITAFPALTTCSMLPRPSRSASSPGSMLVQRCGAERQRVREDSIW